MTCREIISSLGFQCQEIGGGALRVWSPFTYNNDGEHIGLYVQEIPSGYCVTDGCESLMHASSMGINITANRLDAVRRSIGYVASLSDAGEIAAIVPKEDIGRAMAAVLNGSLAVSHLESHWAPKFKADSFVKVVTSVLEASFGERVLKNVPAMGASGHQLELPLAVRLENELVYVQPVASSEDNKVDWRNVYLAYGRMIDLKNASIPNTSRLIVVEEASNDPEMDNVVRLLTETSPLVKFSRLSEWALRKAA